MGLALILAAGFFIAAIAVILFIAFIAFIAVTPRTRRNSGGEERWQAFVAPRIEALQQAGLTKLILLLQMQILLPQMPKKGVNVFG